MVLMKQIIESNPKKQNPYINSLIQVRIKMRKEHTCAFCKQKGDKVINCDRRNLIGNKVDVNYLI